MSATPSNSHSRDAYLWMREFSHEQCRKILAIKSHRRHLPENLQALSRYCRCQLKLSDRAYNVSHSFDGVWNGQPAYFHPILRPVSVDYAERLFTHALRDLHEHYPAFDRHEFADGDRLGERRVIFPDGLDQAAVCWLRTRMLLLHEHPEIAVNETFAAREKPSCFVGKTHIEVELALDRPVTDKATWEEVSTVIKEGRPFPVSAERRKCDYAVVAEMLADLSLPELVLLNWDDARRPLTEADKRLMKAVNDFDISGIRVALESGADANCVDAHDNTPLVDLIESWGNLGDIEYMKSNGEDASRFPTTDRLLEAINILLARGADVNFSPPDTGNALDTACSIADAQIVNRLLDHGGDPSIQCFTDDYPSSWGSAWESADYRCNPVIDNHDESAWNALAARYRPPFDRVSLSANPPTVG